MTGALEVMSIWKYDGYVNYVEMVWIAQIIEVDWGNSGAYQGLNCDEMKLLNEFC